MPHNPTHHRPVVPKDAHVPNELASFELPRQLAERTRLVAGCQEPPQGRLVLYWMRTALRADENPALMAAAHVANQLQLPLLVYQGLSSRYRYASDRHHTFILQGARDVQQQLSQQGISYSCFVELAGNVSAPLQALADAAAVVVTEDMPTDPARKFLRALVAGLSRRNPKTVLAVDTACVVPMQLVGRAYERAFQFRQATSTMLSDRLTGGWPTLDQPPRAFEHRGLPFEAVDLQHADIPDLVSKCNIDHAVGPVADTPGGSAAGYERWQRFKARGLSRYAAQRNDATRDGTSRLSAYLHYGMVSPMRIAREAAASNLKGADKYLDELLVWRELAYGFCHYRADHARWSAIPEWARESLLKHQSDQRPRILSWEQLARGATGDRLWDAAQQSLLMHGELHNNVRMTWGKAILQWTRTPQAALEMLIDLNHRYALDGRDPASYGGILWCLGQFDRPFTPEQPIMGIVRPRTTEQHASRMDVDTYRTWALRPRQAPPPRVAVIGGGLAGAGAARTLADHGWPVTVFEKSRGVGGRMATRMTASTTFDHGAQYFTARDPRFQRFTEAWLAQGLVARWSPRVAVYTAEGMHFESGRTPRFVAVPGMPAIAKHLTQELDISVEHRIAVIEADGSQYRLTTDSGQPLGPFDNVVVAVPAPQAAELCRHFPQLSQQLAQIEMAPCWAMMLELESELQVGWDAAFVNVGCIRWLARNGTKPGRKGGYETLIVHAADDWSLAQLEADPELVASELVSAVQQLTSTRIRVVQPPIVHRWRYALCHHPLDVGCLVDIDRRLVACGDWACGSRVEGAFLSGMAAAGRLLGNPVAGQAPPPGMLF